MERKWGKYAVLIFLGIIAVALIIGYCIWNKPHPDVKDADAVEDFSEKLLDLVNHYWY